MAMCGGQASHMKRPPNPLHAHTSISTPTVTARAWEHHLTTQAAVQAEGVPAEVVRAHLMVGQANSPSRAGMASSPLPTQARLLT